MPLDNSLSGGPSVKNVVTGSRALDTTYQNTTGKALYVLVTARIQTANGAEAAYFQALSDASTPPTTGLSLEGIRTSYVADPQNDLSFSTFFIVLPGNFYKVTASQSGAATVTLYSWVEWH